jgi:tRNA acetyltransferase TAN1
MLNDFNLLATTSRGNERAMTNEIVYILRDELGDEAAQSSKTKIRGLIVAKTVFDPIEVIGRFREILIERPYTFRYALRIVPIQRVVPTNLEEIKNAAQEIAQQIGEEQSYRVTVEKRFTDLHSKEIIEAIASDLNHKVDLHSPDLVLQIEVLGAFTGISLIKPSDVLAVVKEKML